MKCRFCAGTVRFEEPVDDNNIFVFNGIPCPGCNGKGVINEKNKEGVGSKK